MPVTPEYEWSQTDDEVVIEVDLKGITKQKMDVFATDAMVKVVAHPYVLIIDLLKDVDADASAAYTQPGHVTFRLKKRDRSTWERLNHEGTKAEREARRNKSIEAAHAAAEEQRKAHVQRLKKSKLDATNRQIDVDKKKRQAIEAAKSAELQHERAKLQRWQDGEQDGDESDCEPMPEEAPPKQQPPQKDHAEYYGKGFRGKKTKSKTKAAAKEPAGAKTLAEKKQVLVEEVSESSDSDSSEVDIEVKIEKFDPPDAAPNKASADRSEGTTSSEPQPVKLLPPPRPGMQPVDVAFTKLEFPHLPAREKREQELKLYKKTQEDAMRTANSVDISDRQPIYLKDKGDALYAQGNFHAAVNAYSIAIEKDEPGSNLSVLCRMNRAACHSKVSAHGRCIADCSHVVEILQKAEAAVVEGRHPDPGKWKRLLVKALTRRSAAQAHIGDVQDALAGCGRALELDPDSVELRSMQKELEGSAVPADWDALRERAAARYSSKQYAAAAEVYAVLAKRPGATAADAAAATSNQGMCLLSEQQYRPALVKCEAAVLLATGKRRMPNHAWVVAWLQGDSEPHASDDGSAGQVNSQSASARSGESTGGLDKDWVQIPTQGPLVVKNLGRMASCRAHLKEFGAAGKLYEEAASGARTLGLEEQAAAFDDDAEHMRHLEEEERAANAKYEAVEQLNAAAAPAEYVVDGG